MRHTRLTAALAAGLLHAACTDGSEPLALGPAAEEPAFSAQAAQSERWIVVFRPGITDPDGEASRLVRGHGGTLHFTYRHALRGFAARLPAPAVEALRRNPVVAYIEPDAEVQLFDTQNNPPAWGVDRIDQRDLPLTASYTYANNGSGVNAYILDTGVRLTHSDFGGRASYVPNGANGNFVPDTHGSAADCHGHGSHVAGTVGGALHGVAKGVRIWAARVVNCAGSGNVSYAIAAVDWVTANGQRPAVVNMSLGYGDVQSLRTAVENSIAAGVNYAVAAGNGNFLGIPQNACLESPAGAPNALTVGATSSTDGEASFSNYGTCVDILAPGVAIRSAWYNGDNATNSISGTSMATPHVAGAAALYLAANPGATPTQVSNALKNNASTNKISLHSRSTANGTANRLLYVGFIGGSGPGNNPPVASFTRSCTNLTCNFTDTSTDSDGSIVTRSWNFGDGATSSSQNPSHTYASAGTYTVSLTVNDDDGAPASTSQSVTVTAVPAGITLSATGYKVKGRQHTDLTWSGATGASIDVFRDGTNLGSTANDGAYTDAIGAKGGGSYTYRVCQAGTSTCSGNVTVSF
jgi:subtilisin family serine protease